MDQSAIDLVARAMLSLHGSRTVAELRRRAATALDTGDNAAFAAWTAILQAAKAERDNRQRSAAARLRP